jgi:hypothetical protein
VRPTSTPPPWVGSAIAPDHLYFFLSSRSKAYILTVLSVLLVSIIPHPTSFRYCFLPRMYKVWSSRVHHHRGAGVALIANGPPCLPGHFYVHLLVYFHHVLLVLSTNLRPDEATKLNPASLDDDPCVSLRQLYRIQTPSQGL